MSAPPLFACLVLLAAVAAGLSAPIHAEQLDTTFNGTGRVIIQGPANYRSVATLPLPDNSTVSVYEAPNAPGICAQAVCISMLRLSQTGAPLAIATRAAGLERVTAAAIDNSGRVVVVGQTGAGANGRDIAVSRFDATSLDFDPLFGGGSGTAVVSFNNRDEFPTAVAIDSKDRIVVVGSFSLTATDTDFGVLRLLSSGSLDTSFGFGTGRRNVPFDLVPGLILDQANAVAIDNDGRILMAGIAYDSAVSRFRIGLARLSANGDYDPLFCNGGCPANLGFASINNGRTVYYFGAATAHSDEALAIDTLGSGAFIIAGSTYNDNGSIRRAAIARFAASGAIVNETLHDGEVGNAEFRSLRVVDAAGTRIVVAGTTGPDSGPDSTFMMVQAFSASLAVEPFFGNCLDFSSGFCPILGSPPLGDAGPSVGNAIAIDASGRALFQGHSVKDLGDPSAVLVTRYTNASGPRRDLIFRNGVN